MVRKKIESDVLVVGTGIAGSMASYKQAKKNRSVVVIDRGVLLDNELISQVFDQESILLDKQIAKIPIKVTRRHWTRTKYVPCAVGGLARFYAGVSMRMRESEFEVWPFSYEEIEPYYSEAEHLMKISGNEGTDRGEPPRSKPYYASLPPMSGLSQKLFDGAQNMGLQPFQHPFAIHFENCTLCNYCNQVPCPVYAKWSPDRFLLANPELPIEVHQRMEATNIRFTSLGPRTRIESIMAVDLNTKEEYELHAEHFFLAGGAFFTPILLMNSGFKQNNDLIGTHLMTHCLGLVVGVFPSRICSEGGFHKWFSVGDFYFDAEGKVNGMIQQEHITTQKGVIGKLPPWLHGPVKEFYYRTCQLLIIAEDDARIENKIVISPRKGVVIQQTYSKKDQKRRSVLMSKAKKIMKHSGAITSLGYKGQSLYHVCGTARMGTKPDVSVTDQKGRVWGTENLYICDASLFPTSSGVNPSLTIAANSLRVSSEV